jgi:hypothetical protein
LATSLSLPKAATAASQVTRTRRRAPH